MTPLTFRAVWLSASLALAAASAAQAQFVDLLPRVPGSANALVMINIEAAYNSPLARKEKWAEQNEVTPSFDRGFGYTPNAKQILVACDLDLRDLSHRTTLALLELKKDDTIEKIAQQENGAIETIKGMKAVYSPRGSYIVPLAPRLLGIMAPANRQDLGRYLTFTKDNATVQVSEYLNLAAAKANETAPVVMAIDMTDLLPIPVVQGVLAQSPVLAGKTADVPNLAKLISGLKGIMLTFHVDEELRGEIRLDFTNDATPLARFAKPLLIQALEHWGAMIEDIDSWTAQTAGTRVTLSGKLTREGARKLISLIRMPSLPQGSGSMGDSPESANPLPTPPKEASLRYFRSIESLLKDLKSIKRESASRGALWPDRYSHKIDQLPILGVDPELINFGANLAKDLRGMSNMLRGIGYSVDYASATTYGNYGGYEGYANSYILGSSGGSISTTTQSRDIVGQKTMKIQAHAQGMSNLQTLWKQIDDATADIRRKMTEKYQVEFQ